jgi:hypothetical protein
VTGLLANAFLAADASSAAVTGARSRPRRSTRPSTATGAEAGLSPGGTVVVWLKPTQMSATRADIDAVHRRLDAIQQAIGGVATGAGRRPPADEHG